MALRSLTRRMKEAGRLRQWEASLSLFVQALEHNADATAFNTVMSSCVAARKWAVALDIFGQMQLWEVDANKQV
ncbi:unnamed protein product, partial [Symbiodinium sp. CCMP2456]